MIPTNSVAHGNPAVVLYQPKHIHNVAGAIRACSVFGVPRLRWTGRRIAFSKESGERLPREERMKGYRDVDWRRDDRAFDDLGGTPVAVEIRRGAENLIYFEHPPDAVYVFGPEDGSLTAGVLALCHRFVVIPATHCLNLSAAVNIVLFHRYMDAAARGLVDTFIHPGICERRGPASATPALDEVGWDGK
jgi:tRNA(Leu) C34 or U34 (ribose-2'-O)-methylase TrmL